MNITKPPHENVSITKYSNHTNSSVNLDKVLLIKKTREAYYPDNEGIPAIQFWFGGNDYHLWYFDKGRESSRDIIYDELIAQEVIDVKKVVD